MSIEIAEFDEEVAMITGKDNPQEKYLVKEEESIDKYIKKIVLKGLTSQQIPPPSYMIPLLNYIRVIDDIKTKRELEYILALSLISSRRFVQACEILRKIEGYIMEDKKEHNRYLKAAGIEILIAESMNQYFQLHEKLKAFTRAIKLSLGNTVSPSNISTPTTYSNEDVYTFLIHFHPNLLQLLLSLLSDKAEFIKVAAIKSLDFVIENMGCSLGESVITILKTILNTYPSTTEITTDLPKPATFKAIKDNLITIQIPPHNKLISHFNHLLETFGNVLNSVSSQYLHNIFYDIVLPKTYGTNLAPEIRIILLEITERIISICQGDLIPSSVFLNGVLKDLSSGNKKLATAAQNLWQCIKTKLCPNCEKQCRKQLVQWIKENMIEISNKMHTDIASKETIEEDAMLKFDVYIEIACILLADKSTEEIPNPLVITKGENKMDYYELLNPLLYWMNFSIGSEERQDLFNKIWNCITLLLKDMKDALNIDSSFLIESLLKRIKDYCKHSSPSVSMLKLLLAILQSFKNFNKEMVAILCELLNSLADKIPNYPYDEIFIVFDILYEFVVDLLDEHSLKQIILNLTDRYTAKSKAQKETLHKFINIGLAHSTKVPKEKISQTFFGTIIDFCIINNKDITKEEMKKHNHSKVLNKHDKFFNKLNFALESIKQLNKSHMGLYKYLVNSNDIEKFLSDLLLSGYSIIRLKAFDFLDTLCNYFANYCGKIEFVTREQFMLSKYILNLIKSFPKADSYILFNFLNLSDLLFQHILPIPSFESEIAKKQRVSSVKLSKIIVPDLENLDTKEIPLGISLTEAKYLHMRLMAGLKVWSLIKEATESPWSNIRSVSYGVICSLIRIDVNDYKGSFKDDLKTNLLSLLQNMLSSNESETKAGGLNILGAFMGLGYDMTGFKVRNEMNFFRRNSEFISLKIWERVFQLQYDWEGTIKEAATILIQLSAPKESVIQFWKSREESELLQCKSLAKKLNNSLRMISSKFMDKGVKGRGYSPTELLRIDEEDEQDKAKDSSSLKTYTQESLADKIFVIEKYSDDEIKEIISIFKNDFKAPKNLWIENRFIGTIMLEDELVQEIPGNTEGFEEIAPEKTPIEESKSKATGKMLDIMEDRLVNNINKQSQNITTGEDKNYPLKSDTLDAEPFRFLPAEEEVVQEDLDILDLPEGDEESSIEKDKKKATTHKTKGISVKEEEIKLKESEEVKKCNEDIRRHSAELKKYDEEILKHDNEITTYKGEINSLKTELTTIKEEIKGVREEIKSVRIQNEIRELTTVEHMQRLSFNKKSSGEKDEGRQIFKKKATYKPSENSPPKYNASPKRVSNKSTNSGHPIDAKYVKTELTSKLKQRSKPSTSLVLQPKKQNKKDKSSNKSFDHHTVSNSSRSILTLHSHLKKYQASTPGKTGNYLTSQSTLKRRKVQSTRSKQDIPALIQKSQKNARKNLHSNSLPATPRISLPKRLVHPEQLLDNLKFRAKRKDKKQSKKQPQQNFAQTSPALAAILKSLQPSSKTGNEYILKSYRTNIMGTFPTEKSNRPIKMLPKKVEASKNNEPQAAINIDSVQIGFKR